MTCFAEAANDSFFKDYHLIYDDVEGGNLFAIEQLFGEATADRIEPPEEDEDGEPVYSRTVEDFYFHLDDWVKSGEPFIYVLDSQDGLGSSQEDEHFDKVKRSRDKDTEVAGTYGDGKAKFHSSNLRRVLSDLDRTQSILIVINQTRDNIGFGFKPKTRSGGRALEFYACCTLWTSVKKHLKKMVKGKNRTIGVHVRIAVDKNRIMGRSHKIEIPIYPDYGIDDVGSCISFLLEEGHWTKRGPSIHVPEWEWKGREAELITFIEEEDKEKELRELVGNVWKEIIDASNPNRKKRY
jgi:hypothetical protein